MTYDDERLPLNGKAPRRDSFSKRKTMFALAISTFMCVGMVATPGGTLGVVPVMELFGAGYIHSNHSGIEDHNHDHTHDYTVEPSDAPATFEPSEAPQDHDHDHNHGSEPSDAPATFEPSDAPATFEPSDAPATIEPSDAPASRRISILKAPLVRRSTFENLVM